MVHYYSIDNSQTMYRRKSISIIPRDRASKKKKGLSPKELTVFPQKIKIMKISIIYADVFYKIHKKKGRRGYVSTPFDLKFSKCGGNKTNTKLIKIFY